MKYPQIQGLEDDKFRRLTGVKRSTFEKMVSILKDADIKKKAQGGHMTRKQLKKTYTKEFKKEAVSLVLDQGYSVTEAANSLGLTLKSIYSWKQKNSEMANINTTPC